MNSSHNLEEFQKVLILDLRQCIAQKDFEMADLWQLEFYEHVIVKMNNEKGDEKAV